jgi:hypothetical protein
MSNWKTQTGAMTKQATIDPFTTDKLQLSQASISGWPHPM